MHERLCRAHYQDLTPTAHMRTGVRVADDLEASREPEEGEEREEVLRRRTYFLAGAHRPCGPPHPPLALVSPAATAHVVRLSRLTM